MAKTVWWMCAKCGFANKPHPFRKDLTLCEQCGHGRTELEDADYTPRDA